MALVPPAGLHHPWMLTTKAHPHPHSLALSPRHQKDVTGSIDSIYRQYDYSSGRYLLDSADMYAFEYGGYIEKVNSRKNSDEQQQQQQVSRFQAGMLDLASFHAEMGHLKEAEKVGGGQSASAHTHTHKR